MLRLKKKTKNRVILGDNLKVLDTLPSHSADLIYVDPPFNTGKTRKMSAGEFEDNYSDFESFLMPRIAKTLRILKSEGSLFIHLDYREVHYVKTWVDKLFGREKFINEIIWAYDYGGRPKNRWPAKHDTILWYVKNERKYTFNFDAIDRIPYMAPGLVGPEKAKRGKTPTDVWWHTIVPTNGKEKTGYPTQKPFGVLDRLIKVHSNPGDTVLDFFAGSGTTGDAAAKNGRKFILVDINPEAIDIAKNRLKAYL